MTDPRDIQLILLDVDGVLTDGALYIDEAGRESKRFHVRDGYAISVAQALGVRVGVLSGRAGGAVASRVHDLKIDLFLFGRNDKGAGFAELCQQAGVDPALVAYLGDDLLDLPALRQAGYPMAVGDAAAEVKAIARFVSSAKGGHGGAREAIEHILKAKGLWAGLAANPNPHGQQARQ